MGLLLFIAAMACTPTQAAALPAQTFSISGRVTDGFGNGIGNATVTLNGAQFAQTTADASGNYAFNDLPAGGNYDLSALAATGQYLGYGVSVTNLSSNQVVNLRLDPYVTLFIRVTDEAGNGVGDVELKINNFSFPLLRTNANGTGALSISAAMTSGGNPSITLTPVKPGYVFNPSSYTFSVLGGNQNVNFVASLATTQPSSIQFSAPAYLASEGDGSALINVTRTGDTSTSVSINYFTADAGIATQKSDYTMATGTLTFAPGETSKTFRVLITDNAYVQGTHTLFLQLTHPTGSGAVAGSPAFVTLSIFDNDSQTPTTNPLDDAQFFVRQHYHDFLNRVPDAGGLNYWKEQIAGNSSNTPAPCAPGDSACLNSRRVGVSAAYFVENEFQQSGYFIYRIHRAALGLIPDYTHFMVERSSLTPGPQLLPSTFAYTNEFVERPIFKQFYPDTMTPAEFVNKLFDTAGLVPFSVERTEKIQDMTVNGKTRAEVLRELLEIPAFTAKEYNAAFVLMQYYGYLRRDPDPGGYQFWLDVLDSRVQNNYRAMVCAFITSAEYQQRFSPVVTHTNSECGP
jgi:Calx-beta domain/Carboxypeptidase regulatory-like domain/Domain of unknown function (DUF4214)